MLSLVFKYIFLILAMSIIYALKGHVNEGLRNTVLKVKWEWRCVFCAYVENLRGQIR